MTRTAARLGVAVLVLAAALVGSCRSAEEPTDELDGRPRVPDAEGVVAEVSFEAITLEGGGTYRITRDLRCFSTYNLEPLPLLGRKGQYVQLRLDGERVVWLASVGGVLEPGPMATERSVYYTGKLIRLEGRRLIFRDGTVFRLGEGAEAPAPGSFLQVEIDPDRREVRRTF